MLTGPQAISYEQVAADLSVTTGQSVCYANIASEAARSALLEAGLPPFAADQFVALFAELRLGAQGETTDTVRTITGRAPRTFAAFAREYASVFRAGVVPVGA